MTIGELAAKCGAPASSIRYWEKIGVLPKASRVSGQRRYPPEAVHDVALLRLAQGCGFRLREVRPLLQTCDRRTSPQKQWRQLARGKGKEIDREISRLRNMQKLLRILSSCRCGSLAECGRAASSATVGFQL